MPELSPLADKFARAAAIERQLASGGRMHPDQIAELLAARRAAGLMPETAPKGW